MINPDFQLGLDKCAFKDTQHAHYMSKYPFRKNDIFLECMDILMFLSSFTDGVHTFSTVRMTHREINGKVFDHRLDIGYPNQQLFRVFLQTSGHSFVIQHLSQDQNMDYQLQKARKQHNLSKIYILSFKTHRNPDTPGSLGIKKNQGIANISIFYNNSNAEHSPEDDSVTPVLFYSVAPFHPKTEKRKKNLVMNPDNTLEGVFSHLGGKLIKFELPNPPNKDLYQFGIFIWFSPYFLQIFASRNFGLASTIELDATFDSLHPYVSCTPQLIFRNTGIPLALMAAPTESSALYSLFFEGLKALDRYYGTQEKKLLTHFLQKQYLTDEHTSFTKLQLIYTFELHNCYAHLIRSVGANSVLSFFLSDLLYTYSEEEWNTNLSQNIFIFQKIYAHDPKPIEKRYIKVSQVLGYDVNGNPCPTKPSYSPIYKRLNGVPTTTNHIEAYNKHSTQFTKQTQGNLFLTLAYLGKYISDRTLRSNLSAEDNLKAYLKKISDRAKSKVQKKPDLLVNYSQERCNCPMKIYMSSLFSISVPCIHEILNSSFDQKNLIAQLHVNDLVFLENLPSNQFDVLTVKTNLEFNDPQDENETIDNTISVNFDDGEQDPTFDDPMKAIVVKAEKLYQRLVSQNESFTMIALEVQSKLGILKDNPTPAEALDYYAEFQVSLWSRIELECKKHK